MQIKKIIIFKVLILVSSVTGVIHNHKQLQSTFLEKINI